MLWDNTVNKAYRVKGEIQPLQNAAADGVRKDIANFGEEVRRRVAKNSPAHCPPPSFLHVHISKHGIHVLDRAPQGCPVGIVCSDTMVRPTLDVDVSH